MSHFNPANFLTTLMANVDNPKLSDTAFRNIVRNTVPTCKGHLDRVCSTWYVQVGSIQYPLMPGGTAELTNADQGKEVRVYLSEDRALLLPSK